MTGIPDPEARPPETPLSRALRRMAKGKRLSSLDVPVLDDAADELDELTASQDNKAVPPVREADPRWERLYNIVTLLAHPSGDRRKHPLETEAHDIIRGLRHGKPHP